MVIVIHAALCICIRNFCMHCCSELRDIFLLFESSSNLGFFPLRRSSFILSITLTSTTDIKSTLPILMSQRSSPVVIAYLFIYCFVLSYPGWLFILLVLKVSNDSFLLLHSRLWIIYATDPHSTTLHVRTVISFVSSTFSMKSWVFRYRSSDRENVRSFFAIYLLWWLSSDPGSCISDDYGYL